MPEIVEPYLGQLGTPQRGLESAVEVAAQHWRTDDGGKHETVILPLWTLQPIAYVAGTQIHKTDVNNLKETPLTVGTWPTWSPDGEKIAFVGNKGIYVMDADGSNVTPIFDAAGV